MAGYEYITVMPMVIPRSYPDSVLAWRNFPAPWLPHIGIATPTLITRNPYMPAAGRDGSVFPDGDRRSELNYNILCGRNSDGNSTQYD